MQHWVIDSAVYNCYSCGLEFTFTERKHHCRDCGQIFCARCFRGREGRGGEGRGGGGGREGRKKERKSGGKGEEQGL